MRIWMFVTLALFFAGCDTGVQPIEGEGSPQSGPKITSDQAVNIAKKRLEAESFANSIDAARMTVKYSPHYGPSKAPFACWVVDFAKVGSGEVAAGSGLWAEGYQVFIDPDTGKVKEAALYER